MINAQQFLFRVCIEHVKAENIDIQVPPKKILPQLDWGVVDIGFLKTLYIILYLYPI